MRGSAYEYDMVASLVSPPRSRGSGCVRQSSTDFSGFEMLVQGVVLLHAVLKS